MIYFRIDDRLIHGQVITSWTRFYDLKHIIIIDDAVANDMIQKKIIEMVTPSSVNVEIIPISDSLNKMRNINENTMILVKTPLTLLELLEQDINVPEVIIGGMQFSSGKTKLSSAVSVNDVEKNALITMLDKDVEIFVQMIPTEKKRKFKDLI